MLLSFQTFELKCGINILGGNPLLVPVDDEDLLAEEDDDEEGDKVSV